MATEIVRLGRVLGWEWGVVEDIGQGLDNERSLRKKSCRTHTSLQRVEERGGREQKHTQALIFILTASFLLPTQS